MADLIDREAVLDYIEQLNNCRAAKRKSLEFLRRCVEDLPTAERVGKWNENENNKDILNCSECGEPVWKIEADSLLRTTSKYNYCPNCGRRMESEE